VKRRKSYTLRFTVTQNHFMRCNACDLKLPEWETRFQAWYDSTVNLKKLTADQLQELRRILKRAGRPGIYRRSRPEVTRRALRRKLCVLKEFIGLSAIDRLGELSR
jgi:hypothetical protein